MLMKLVCLKMLPLITCILSNDNDDLKELFRARFKISGDRGFSSVFVVFVENILKTKNYEEIAKKANSFIEFTTKFRLATIEISTTKQTESPIERLERTSDGVLHIYAEELHIIGEEIKERLVPIEAFLSALIDKRAFEKNIGNDLDLTEVRALRKYLQLTNITTKNVDLYKNELKYYKMFIVCFLFNKNILEQYKKMKIEKELDENDNKIMKYVKTILLFIIVMLIAFCVLTVIVVICKWFMRKKRPLQE